MSTTNIEPPAFDQSFMNTKANDILRFSEKHKQELHAFRLRGCNRMMVNTFFIVGGDLSKEKENQSLQEQQNRIFVLDQKIQQVLLSTTFFQKQSSDLSKSKKNVQLLEAKPKIRVPSILKKGGPLDIRRQRQEKDISDAKEKVSSDCQCASLAADKMMLLIREFAQIFNQAKRERWLFAIPKDHEGREYNFSQSQKEKVLTSLVQRSIENISSIQSLRGMEKINFLQENLKILKNFILKPFEAREQKVVATVNSFLERLSEIEKEDRQIFSINIPIDLMSESARRDHAAASLVQLSRTTNQESHKQKMLKKLNEALIEGSNSLRRAVSS